VIHGICGEACCDADDEAEHVGDCPPRIFGIWVADICDNRRNESEEPCALSWLAMYGAVRSLTYNGQRDCDECEGVANDVAARELASP
jgi:hypothetical protein